MSVSRPVPTMPELGRCGSCQAPVYWALSPKGQRSPIDEGLDAEKGNVLLIRPRGLAVTLAVTLSGAALQEARGRDVPLHLSHWSTCPDKAEWRAKQEAKRAAKAPD